MSYSKRYALSSMPFLPATCNLQPAPRNPTLATRNAFLFHITVVPFFESFNFGDQLFLCVI
jgi:hypothetical protein